VAGDLVQGRSDEMLGLVAAQKSGDGSVAPVSFTALRFSPERFTSTNRTSR